LIPPSAAPDKFALLEDLVDSRWGVQHPFTVLSFVSALALFSAALPAEQFMQTDDEFHGDPLKTSVGRFEGEVVRESDESNASPCQFYLVTNKPDALIKQELEKLRSDDQMSPDLVFRDPYL